MRGGAGPPMLDCMAASNTSESFQIPLEAAERYEAAFVPNFFAQWAPTLCASGGVAPGRRLLDVACGTGIVARTAADLNGSAAGIVGIDLNEAMLTVARRIRADIDWRQGDAASLPFADGSFDTVLSQMALMFLPDRAAAIGEMARVVTDAGTVAVLVPGTLDRQPAFEPFVELASQLVGPDAVSLLTTYFVCGDLDELSVLFESAGLAVTTTRTVSGTYAAPSVEAAVRTEVESTPLIERIDEQTYARLREETAEIWRPFTAADGTLAAPFESVLIAASRKP
jgi:ubiquinone/menaquinone biosynthesis C-methylase UbiE